MVQDQSILVGDSMMIIILIKEGGPLNVDFPVYSATPRIYSELIIPFSYLSSLSIGYNNEYG